MSREHKCRKRIFDCITSPVANGTKLSYPSFENLIFVDHTQYNSVKQSDSQEKHVEDFGKYTDSFTVQVRSFI